MRNRPWLAAALVLGWALIAAPSDSAGQTAQPAQPAQAAQAAQAAQPAQPAAFTAAQLEQLVAPIALYPDSLLSQVLIGSTYPLEVVEAARWVKKNSALKGTALEEALTKQDWDESVKTLCGFPEALNKMNENLDWMQDLGDAFLGQQAEVMDAVQRMRAKAFESGNLKSSEQQTVTQTTEKIVVIEPATEVIYVPAYSPTVVYGGWGYPSYYYPSMYVPPPPPPPGAGLVTFTAGVFMGAAVGAAFDWGHHDVYVHPPPRPGGGGGDRPAPPGGGQRPPPGGGDRPTPPGGGERPTPPGGGSRPEGGKPGGPQGQPPGGTSWQHNPEHRKGVNYQNQATAQKYGGGSPSQVSREQARGQGGQPPSGGPSGSRPPSGGGAPSGSRPPSGGGPSGGGPSGGGPSAATRDRQPPSASQGSRAPSGGAPQRPSSTERSYSSPGGTRTGAYSGSSSPSIDRSASSRGSTSRSAPSYSGSKSSGSRPSGGGSRPSGGGSRPSGGGGGRGGGGRR